MKNSVNELEFYQQCAIAAMQGIQEIGGKFGILADAAPKEVAKLAFNFADAMWEEYNKRINGLSVTLEGK